MAVLFPALAALEHYPPWIWLLAAAVSLAALATALATHRLLLHPLAAYPGPLWARVTDLHQLWHAYRGDRHLELYRLHETYGPVVRFGPNSLSIRSAAGLHDIYASFRANVAKSDFYSAFVHPAPNTHNTRDRAVHARKRRVLSHGFSDAAVRSMEGFVIASVDQFCKQVGAGAGATGDGSWTRPKCMSDFCSYLAMDILGDLCFGKAFHMLERDDNRYALDLVTVATRRHLICGTMPLIDRLRIDRLLFPSIAAGRARYMAYSKAQLTERTAMGEKTDRKDFFYHLLTARDPETGQGFSTPELWGESNLLIIAGSDTTSTALAATFFYLVRSPDALARATAEVRATFGGPAEIRSGPKLASCSYLRACIDEAMRLSPSVGGMLPREVLAGGLTVDGLVLPAGTVVGVPHYALHHDASHFPSPFRFVPERWIAGAENPLTSGPTSDEDVARAQAAFCAFSVGPRGCIGRGLAYAEMGITMARVLLEFDIRRAAGGVPDPAEGRPGAEWGRDRPDEMQLRDVFTSIKEGVLVEFRRRAGWEKGLEE